MCVLRVFRDLETNSLEPNSLEPMHFIQKHSLCPVRVHWTKHFYLCHENGPQERPNWMPTPFLHSLGMPHGNISQFADWYDTRIYPTRVNKSGWYDIPGYYYNSPQIVLSGFRYLRNAMDIRIWFGEDLYNWTEFDNHGHTCMDVYIYK